MTQINHIVQLINRAIDVDINLSLKEDKLVLKTGKDRSIDPGLLQDIRKNKEEIIAFLKKHSKETDSVHQDSTSITAFDRSLYPFLPLSYAQERLWSVDNLIGGGNYHVPYVWRFSASLNVEALKFAFRSVIDRHEVLRTVFKENQGVPYQEVLSIDAWDWTYLELQEALSSEDLGAMIDKEIKIPFDLSTDHLLRTKLIKLADQSYVVILTSHHIASDGFSKDILVKELLEFYQAKIDNRIPALNDLEIQYADYAIWQREVLSNQFLENSLSYWDEKLKAVEILKMPTDFVRPRIQSQRGDAAEFVLDKKTSQSIEQICKEEGLTLFMFLMAAFKVLLYRYSGQTDICLGSPMTNRNQKELEGLIGFFVNTIVLRDDLSNNPSFKEFLAQVKNTTLEAYQFQDIPFEKIVDHVVEARDISTNPLVQVMFVLQNSSEDSAAQKTGASTGVNDYELLNVGEEVSNEYEVSKFDMTVNLFEKDGEIVYKIKYCKDLFKRSTIEQMGTHYKEILKSIVSNPEAKLNDLDILNIAEEEKITEAYNNTKSIAYPKEKNIVDLFVEQVNRTPEHTAVKYGDQSLTYRDLDAQSNQLATYLLKKGVQAEELIGVCLSPSIEMVVSILGIIKAGGTYVPMDPDYPMDRLEYMTKDSKIQFMIGNKSTISIFSEQIPNFISIDEEWSEINMESNTLPEIKINPDQSIYIIYTSGSTGQPKGVILEHRNVVRLFKTDAPLFDFNANDVWTLFHSFCFDFSVWEMYGALLFGGKLIIVPKEIGRDAVEYSKLLQTEGVTVLNQTPSSFYSVQNYFTSEYKETTIRYVIFGGEALAPSRLHDWKTAYPDCKLVNMYGITETTVHVTYQEINTKEIEAGVSNIGQAIPTLNCYILNPQMNLVPAGVSGEIYVSGAGLARGYLNRPELTAERFIANPFSKDPNDRLYKTGDLARWSENGQIEYLGRLDDQVKIRAYRVELGEVTAALESCELVKQGVVIAKEDSIGNKRLIAYVVPENTFDKNGIRNFMTAKLPKFMVPAIFMEMSAFSLTVNGKLDKTALPEPDLSNWSGGEKQLPGNEVEQQIAEIWQELLEVEQVGMQDDFFELGGHSLLATRVAAAIREAFKIKIGTQDIFMNPTVSELAEMVVDSDQETNVPAISVADRSSRIPLSYAQERLWFIDRMNGSTAFHIPFVQAFKTTLNVDALEYAINTIVNRHESLRTILKEEEGTTYQTFLAPDTWKLNIRESADIKEEKALRQLIATEINRPFDLEKDHMLRAELFDLGEKGYLLVLVLHHIASDGWSMNILINEVLELYHSKVEDRAVDLAPVTIQYADYANWQQNYLTGDVLENQLDYWETQLKGVANLNLPTDFKRPDVQSMKGDRVKFNIDTDLVNRLNTLGEKNQVTLFMVLLSAFKVLLYRYSGQSDICVGTPVANRSQKELEGMIGFFVNMIALRSDLKSDKRFSDLLQEVKTTTLKGFDFQDTPFEKIVDRVIETRNTSRSPLFQICFGLQNMPNKIKLKEGTGNLEGQQLSQEEFDFSKAIHKDNYQISKYDLSMHATEYDGGMQIMIEYSTKLFKESTIQKMGRHYLELLEEVTTNDKCEIQNFEILSEEEQQMLKAFNNTETTYPNEASVVDVFRDQVQKYPEQTALVYEETKTTYAQLEQQSNEIAIQLVQSGVKPGDLVGVCINRSTEMIAGVLGILKAGAAYVPIDSDYPQQRIQFMVDDAKLQFVLCGADNIVTLMEIEGPQLILANVEELFFDEDALTVLPQDIDANAPAYLMYTSGSTGKPKGVLIKHQSILRLLFNDTFEFLNQNTVLYQYAPLSFDASTFEVWGALLKGGQLCIPSPGTKSLQQMEEDFNKYQINTIWLTAGLFHLMADARPEALKTIKFLLAGGESIRLPMVEKVLERYPGLTFINGYGPTESTTFAVMRTIKGLSEITSTANIIGKPIGNTKAYVLNSEGVGMVPLGCPGELCLAGPGLALEYLGNPELTGKKFIANPYSSGAYDRLYRTGDIVQWLEDGTIEFIGRKDSQIKIRGYRIELGEVESVLNNCPLIKQAVALVIEDERSEKRIVAYVIPADDYSKEDVFSYLKLNLPVYSMPSLLIDLEYFPLTGNGKLDTKALPKPDASAWTKEDFVAPRNEMEEQLAAIWRELLGLEKIGVNDNFFDLGGHSLLLIRVIAAIQNELSITIPISAMFKYNTIADLYKYVRTVKHNVDSVEEEEDLDVIRI